MECPLTSLDVAETATFRSGDVVLLKSAAQMSESALERLHHQLRELHERTGVAFVLLEPSLEVVVPTEMPA